MPAPIPTETPDRAEGATALLGYTLLRRLGSGDRVDVFLARAAAAGADPGAVAPTVALRVAAPDADGDALATEIDAMERDRSGALPALVDVGALEDGRVCVVVERCTGGSLGRVLAARSLSPGEAVTVLAALVDASASLAEAGFVHTRWSPGDVLFDDRGRPRLIGLSALARLPEGRRAAERTALIRDGHRALAALMAHVADATTPSGCLDPVLALADEVLERRPFLPAERELERALFAVAAPEPVREVHRPAASPGGIPARVPSDGARTIGPVPMDPEDPGEDAAPTGVLGVLAAVLHIPVEVLTRRSARDPQAVPPSSGGDDGSVGGVAGLRRALAGKRRPLVFGGVVGSAALVAALVVVGPNGADAGATEPGAGETTSAPVRPGPVGATGTEVPPAEGEPERASVADGALTAVEAAQILLRERERCFDALDLLCLDAVVQADSPLAASDRDALLAARDGEPAVFVRVGELAVDGMTEVADLGDAVLVSAPFASAEREPASLLLMRSEAGWRLREIFD